MQTLDAAVRPQGVRLKQPAFVFVIVWVKGNAATLQVGGVLGYLLYDVEQRVGGGEVVLDLHYVALEGILGIVNYLFYDNGLHRQLQLGTPLQLFLQQVVREVVLRQREQLYEQNGCNNNQQPASFPERLYVFDQITHPSNMPSVAYSCYKDMIFSAKGRASIYFFL